MKYRRVVLAMIGDTHAGSRGGLTNPETVLEGDDGPRKPSLSALQGQFWEWHEEARKEIGKLAGQDELILVEMGDLTQGGKYRDGVSESALGDQYVIAKENIMPWLRMPVLKRVYFATGTGAHTFGDGLRRQC